MAERRKAATAESSCGMRSGSVNARHGESGGDRAAISVGKFTAIGLNVSGGAYIFVVAG